MGYQIFFGLQRNIPIFKYVYVYFMHSNIGVHSVNNLNGNQTHTQKTKH